MPDFTPGPWVVEKDNLHPFFYVSKDKSKTFLAAVNNEANARLIAAAPDMYNFVRCVYEMSKTLDEEDDDYFIHEAAKKILDRIHGSEDHAHDTDA